jgi:hypothetical protein
MSSSAALGDERGDRGDLPRIGIAEDKIHVERFVSESGGKPRPKQTWRPARRRRRWHH